MFNTLVILLPKLPNIFDVSSKLNNCKGALKTSDNLSTILLKLTTSKTSTKYSDILIGSDILKTDKFSNIFCVKCPNLLAILLKLKTSYIFI